MQKERSGRNGLFGLGDSFGAFRGFNTMPSLFGGRDPFDDPFFTRPSGSMFESSKFQHDSHATGDASDVYREKGVVIEEVTSDGEDEDGEAQTMNKKNNHREHFCSNEEPSVEHPDDFDVERSSKNVNHGCDYDRSARTDSQTRSLSFQTSKVTYGGVDGAYYTSTRDRRMGNDGVLIEESKEVDKTTGQATHRICRGIHDKGHSVTRKLNTDGKVDTVQTLHNLNKDELAGFEEAWKINTNGKLSDWSDPFGFPGTSGSSRTRQKGMGNWEGWALPSTEQGKNAGGDRTNTDALRNSAAGRTRKLVRINIE
ncbi:hypothetical protein K2173_013314 [Erythroxylum novogranatense]|uniref:Myeloid leukemia factor 1 n=1 Tax=Erythroxylum novogranatense TaxID=1862640 RepID=A0AAV8S9J5_9ROSI|nr:hypothetical protein K2173_013314 [Erythroxylum novogranatense]